jgi:hypothetical protein
VSKKHKEPAPEVVLKDAPHSPFEEGIRRRTEARDRARAQKMQQRRELLDAMADRSRS